MTNESLPAQGNSPSNRADDATEPPVASGAVETKDGLTLRYYDFGDPTSLSKVLMVHGLGEHQGRHVEFARSFARTGFHVRTFDLRGHGESQGSIGHSPSYHHLLDDLDQVVADLLGHRTSNRDSELGMRLALYGHSFGGALILNYLIRKRTPGRTDHPITAVVTAPLLRPVQRIPGWKYHLGRLVATLLPRVTFSIGVKSSELSDEQERIEMHRRDKACHGRVSARLAKEMLEQGEWLLAHAADLQTPIRLLHGAHDSVTSESASREFAAANTEYVNYYCWENMPHELHHTSQRDDVLDDAIRWLSDSLLAVS